MRADPRLSAPLCLLFVEPDDRLQISPIPSHPIPFCCHVYFFYVLFHASLLSTNVVPHYNHAHHEDMGHEVCVLGNIKMSLVTMLFSAARDQMVQVPRYPDCER